VPEVAGGEERPEERSGPDFSNWPRDADAAWKLVMDIEYCARIQAAMDGPAPHGVPEYEEAVSFLATQARYLRAELGAMICRQYGIEPDDEDDRSPFAGAGRPIAFGAERQQRPET
jgi:hypothetical protein